jgi:hypothetical protein
MKLPELNKTYDITVHGRSHRECTLVSIAENYIFDVASCYGLILKPSELSEAIVKPIV